MIRKLQKRFVRIAVLVLTAAMVVVVGIVNTANLLTVRGELAGTVKELADSQSADCPGRACRDCEGTGGQYCSFQRIPEPGDA